MTTEPILMPNRLTAENGAKARLTGEFSITIELGDEVYDVPVPWRTIKEIYDTAVRHFHHESEQQTQYRSNESENVKQICQLLGFDPSNHHNAAKCPYCKPE